MIFYNKRVYIVLILLKGEVGHKTITMNKFNMFSINVKTLRR